MIKIEDINTSITTLLSTQLNLEVYGSEVKQGFKRPCFFMQIMPIEINIATTNYSENLITIEVVYFSKGATDLENVQMYDKLYALFSKPLAINDRKILPQNIRAETDDGGTPMTFNSLSFKFNLKYFNDLPDRSQPTETMKQINLNLKGGSK